MKSNKRQKLDAPEMNKQRKGLESKKKDFD
jgi:hypothetical protein